MLGEIPHFLSIRFWEIDLILDLFIIEDLQPDLDPFILQVEKIGPFFK